MVAVISYTWKTDPYKEDEDKYKVPWIFASSSTLFLTALFASYLFSTSLSQGLYCTQRLAVTTIQGMHLFHSALLSCGYNWRHWLYEDRVWSM